MRHTSLIHATIFSIVLALAASYPDDSSLAQAGCCLQRANPGSPWVVTNLTFAQCDTENRQNDGDDIFIAAGQFWWNINC